MQRLIITTIFAASALAAACDPVHEPTQPREAPDVPWPAVTIDAEVKTPLYAADVLAECFAHPEITYGAPTLVHYEDQAPDGDDQQPMLFCVAVTTHLDTGDCVRQHLLALGGKVSF